MTPLRIVRYVIYFVALLLLQTIVIDPLNLGRWATPIVYVLFIIVLPAHVIPPWQGLLIAFVGGIVAGNFSESSGVHASAMLFTMLGRYFLLPLFMAKAEAEKGLEPNLFTMGYRMFFFYSASLTFIYLFVFTLLEMATLHYFFNTIATVFTSTLVTLALIFIIQLLMYRNKPSL